MEFGDDGIDFSPKTRYSKRQFAGKTMRQTAIYCSSCKDSAAKEYRKTKRGRSLQLDDKISMRGLLYRHDFGGVSKFDRRFKNKPGKRNRWGLHRQALNARTYLEHVGEYLGRVDCSCDFCFMNEENFDDDYDDQGSEETINDTDSPTNYQSMSMQIPVSAPAVVRVESPPASSAQEFQDWEMLPLIYDQYSQPQIIYIAERFGSDDDSDSWEVVVSA